MDLEAQLGDLGCIVVGKATNLDRGIILAGQLEIDVAVLDVNLGSSNSISIADQLQARGIPFMFASGYTDLGIPERYRECVRVAKPYDISSLRRALLVLLTQKMPS
nr:D425 [uncultured bacterium]